MQEMKLKIDLINAILNKIKEEYPLDYGEQLINPLEFYELVEDFKK